MKKRLQTPEYRIVMVQRERFREWKTAGLWCFRLLLLSLIVGIFLYNQYALSSVMKTVEELKRSLLTTRAELPIKRMLEERAGDKLTELERIRITQLIAAKEAHGIDPYFTLDLIRRESTFNPWAVSSTGAVGLMQLLPSTAKWIARREGIAGYRDEILFDPVTNVDLGMKYLVYLARDFKGEESLRAAYQLGPARARERREGGTTYASNP